MKLRSFLDTLTNIVGIEVLPYHTKGIQKWKQMGLVYPIPEIKEPDQMMIEHAERILKNGYLFCK
jgi:pyruvate formate lyase activating enzyme